MSLPEIQRDAVEMMRIQGVLKFMQLDPRVARPVLIMRQTVLQLLRSYPIEDFK